MADNNRDHFNKVAKGAAIGAGSAIVAAAVLPVVTVSLPFIAIGAAIGGYISHKKDQPNP